MSNGFGLGNSFNTPLEVPHQAAIDAPSPTSEILGVPYFSFARTSVNMHWLAKPLDLEGSRPDPKGMMCPDICIISGSY